MASDAGIKAIIGDPRSKLICTDKKKPDGTIDDNANSAITLTNLAAEADRLSMLVEEQSNCVTLTNNCAKFISAARTKLSTQGFKADDVLDDLDTVKRYLVQSYKSRSLWPKTFTRLLIYNCILLAGFVGMIAWKSLFPDSGKSSGMAIGILACAMWGGIGSVIDALGALISHFGHQDFDEQYQPWYYLHPLIGMALGAVVYLVFQAGLSSISNSAITTEGKTTTMQVGVTALSIVVAFLAGFKQTSTMKFLNRIVNSIFQIDGNTTDKST